MALWTKEITCGSLNGLNRGTMMDYLDITFTEVGDDFISARMPIDDRTKQPAGIMHGGASCVLAETVGSIAANCCLDHAKQYAVGLDINTSHLKMVRTGHVIGTARPINIGKTVHVWEIRIVNDAKELVSITRLTLMVLNRR